MSETELEVLQRLVDSKDLRVVIVDWGIAHEPTISFGDKRIRFQFDAVFHAPIIPIPVFYLDFEIQTQAGEPIHRVRQPTVYGGEPLLLGAGHAYSFVVDIAIDHMDPAFVRRIKPGAHGLTTRRGNMHLTTDVQELLHQVEEGEAKVRELDQQILASLTRPQE